MRRIITGHNESGKSVVSIEGPPSRSLGEDAGGLYEIGILMEGALILSPQKIGQI